MSASTDRPWLRYYPEGVDPDPELRFTDLGAAWADRVRRHRDQVAIKYFDGALTTAQVDDASDALAVAMQYRGVKAGDRVAVYLQNVPHFVIAMLALWKIGATVVTLNPMYRGAQLRQLIDDCRPTAVVMLHADVSATEATLVGTSVSWVIGVDDVDFQTRSDPRLEWSGPHVADDDFGELLRRHEGRRPQVSTVAPDDAALICYTSGTTGPPKGAVSSHANILHSAANFGSWLGIDSGDVVLGIAPMFHISGTILNAALALFNDAALSLVGRYQPDVVLEAFGEHGVTFTIGSITAFNALLALDHASHRHLSSVRLLYSGGAPIPPATVEKFQNRFGHVIHNVWGMTETTAGGIAVPPGSPGRIDPATGTLSIGVPTPGATVHVIDSDGAPLPHGEEGELVFAAPQVITGYWQNPEATAATLPGGSLRTGDGAVIDEDGWVYLVDRLKDQINTSGYKVWPREVEDVLSTHPDVFEAAVVGEPDEYRGEAVVAHVSLVPGSAVTPSELRELVRRELPAYKVPRTVHIVDELPKTATGKIRRGGLREEQSGVLADSGTFTQPADRARGE